MEDPGQPPSLSGPKSDPGEHLPLNILKLALGNKIGIKHLPVTAYNINIYRHDLAEISHYATMIWPL